MSIVSIRKIEPSPRQTNALRYLSSELSDTLVQLHGQNVNSNDVDAITREFLHGVSERLDAYLGVK